MLGGTLWTLDVILKSARKQRKITASEWDTCFVNDCSRQLHSPLSPHFVHVHIVIPTSERREESEYFIQNGMSHAYGNDVCEQAMPVFMQMENKTIVQTIALSLVILTIAYNLVKPAKIPQGLRAVPGPRGWPILGNLPQLGKHPQQALQRWAKQYGPVFQIRLGWENHVYVNDPAAVKDIFDRQSAVTSGRQPFPVLSDIMSGGKRVLFMTHNKEWRALRGVVHQLLMPKASATFMPSQEFEAKQMLSDILHDQEKGVIDSAYGHVRRYTISVIMTSTYGTRVPRWVCGSLTFICIIMHG